MIITFNALGVITSTNTTDEALRQGNVGNTLKAIFQGKNNLNYTANIAYTRSDGQHISGIQLTPDAADTTKFVYEFDDPWFFAKDGTTTCTINLVNAAGTIVVTGQITFSIEKTDFSDDDPQITVTQYNSLLTTLSAKLNIQNGIVAIARKSDIVISEYQEGQMFYVTTEDNFYKLVSSNLVLINSVAVILNPTITQDSSLPVEKINRPVCFMIYSDVIYTKSRVEGNNVVFVSDYRIISGNNTQSDTFGRVEYRFNKNTGAFDSFTQATKQVYNKGQIDEQFFNKNQAVAKFVDFESDQEISGKKTFAQLPETKAGRTYGSQRQMADKELVDQVQTNLNTHAGRTDNPHSVKASQVGLGNVTNDAQVKRTEMGVALGVATLDANGKLVYVQIPDILLGQMTYGGTVTGAGLATLSTNGKTKLGTSENTLQLTNDTTALTGYTSNEGLFYLVTIIGAFAGLDLQQGDWLVANASGWSKIDNTDAVRSVQGRIGDVVIVKSDLGLEYIESDIAPLYDDTATYEVGDVVVYQGKLYQCVEDVEVAESFDTIKWAETNVKTLISNLKGYTDNLMYKVPEYVDITIGVNDWDSENEAHISSGVLDLESDDQVVCLPNGALNESLIKAYDVQLTSFTDATGVANFKCKVVPEESIGITLQILRR